MNIYKLYSKYFLSLLVSMLAMVAVTSCSDDDEELMQSGYGYVQFKLCKSTSGKGWRMQRRYKWCCFMMVPLYHKLCF